MASAPVGSIDTTARAEREARTVKLGERTTMMTTGLGMSWSVKRACRRGCAKSIARKQDDENWV